jgi:hypothetical protein
MATIRHSHIVALALAFTLAPVNAQQPQPLNPPLKNWAAPLYWAPTPAEFEQQRIEQHIAHPDASPSAQSAGIFSSPGPMTFIAMTPCRVMDTRSSQPFTGAFGPPSLAAFTTRQVPMPSSSCNIPANAGAYSLNITVVPPGALSFLTVWPAGQPFPTVSTLNDPISGGVVANAAIVVAGTSGAIQMVAGNPTDVIIDINGYYGTPTDSNSNTGIGAGALSSNTSGGGNTASGFEALQGNTTGSENVASGFEALLLNTTGNNNTATGFQALLGNTTGTGNTASGSLALYFNTTGSDNTATGYQALESNTACCNTATGYQAMQSNTTGTENTASGLSALYSNTTGSENTANGLQALYSNTTGSYNTATGMASLVFNTSGLYNTADGYQALNGNTTGGSNTASGYQALFANHAGGSNTADGFQALYFNNSSYNTASGWGALYNNSTGDSNTASGYQAIYSNQNGVANTASGSLALYANTTGSDNTAFGYDALENNTTGSFNIALGYLAANNVSGVHSNNIHIGNPGAFTDNGVIKIGSAQTVAYIAGIYGANNSGIPVYINSSGQLGTTASSRRFKEQITDMGDTSSKLLQLRPVNFFYKPEYDDGSHSLQYGLIAEEVEKVYPEMVAYDKDGQIMTVKYQLLAPMLLNEVQKQNARLQSQAEAIQAQQDENRKLEDRLATLEALLSGQVAKTAASQ